MAEGDIITMKQKELRRLHVVHQILDKKLKQVEAADKIDLSYRQTKRITKRVRNERLWIRKDRGYRTILIYGYQICN